MVHLFILDIGGRLSLLSVEADPETREIGAYLELRRDGERVERLPLSGIVCRECWDRAAAPARAAALQARYALPKPRVESPLPAPAAGLLALFCLFFQSSCACVCDSLGLRPAAGPGPARIEVDTKARVLLYGPIKAPVEISRVGLGDSLGSRRTPTGAFTVSKEAGHRFGPVLRLSGYQGHRRGILIHRDLTRGPGTNGCIALDPLAMRRLYDAVPPEGTALLIY
jgi:hypothetical protein